jgi:hypothetical protein
MNPRVDENLKGMLQIFARMFGEGFWANSIFLFTRWAVDEKTEKKRGKKGGGKTMDQFYEEFKVVMNECFRIFVERD